MTHRDQIKIELQRLPVDYCKLLFGLIVWRKTATEFVCHHSAVYADDGNPGIDIDSAAEYILKTSPVFDLF